MKGVVRSPELNVDGPNLETPTWVTSFQGLPRTVNVRRCRMEVVAGPDAGKVIELTAKARRLRMPVAEIPTIWLDRQAGVSNFKLAKWIPGYLRWYLFAFGQKLTAEQVRSSGHPARKESALP